MNNIENKKNPYLLKFPFFSFLSRKRSFLIILSALFPILSYSSLLFAQETPIDKQGYANAKDFANSLGLSYHWFPIQKMVILSNGTTMMRLIVNQKSAVIDNKPFTLPSPPILIDGQVMIPAQIVRENFGIDPIPSKKASAKPKKNEIPDSIDAEAPNSPAIEPEVRTTSLSTEPPINPSSTPVETNNDGAILIALRHSIREDQTRVVLEFDNPVSFKLESLSERKFKLRIDGCQNIIPKKRSDPVGRDIENMLINSGAGRKGLVISLELPKGSQAPTAETVANPFRIILLFKSSQETPIAASTSQEIKPPVQPEPTKIASQSIGIVNPKPVPTNSQTPILATPSSQITPIAEPLLNLSSPPTASEPIPDIFIDVPLASLSRTIFHGRTIVIDPGHGGTDLGATISGSESEKQIALSIAQKVKKSLISVGLKAVLLRTEDVNLSQSDRQSLANRAGGDLLISIHVGASQDESLEGCSCLFYESKGTSFDLEVGSKLSPQLIYKEWCKTSRFDLAKFLALKISDRIVKHLSITDRGNKSLPLLPLRFLVLPAVLVEVGMLTNQTEGKNLNKPGYVDAVAKAITNGIVDFFNSIRISQE